MVDAEGYSCGGYYCEVFEGAYAGAGVYGSYYGSSGGSGAAAVSDDDAGSGKRGADAVASADAAGYETVCWALCVAGVAGLAGSAADDGGAA